ncbi:TPA: tyrosine-protein kinase Wzc [Serratia fonticola]|uniref:tyrosine-protein kinase Wzc n=1 Tax=Serratia fonticola TaxID=47917 RepID=UPI0021838D61|nr:tyrosine-protein kinase Wzc [Serratia fonticola]CAI2432757.1 Tyrosine-protein kinase wzc [Serratia fonticola]
MSIDKAATTAGNSGEEIDLGRLLGTLIDHRWLITGIVTSFIVIGLVYSLFATPVYQADAMIQVEQNAGSSLLSNLSEMLPTNSKPASATEIQLIKSRLVLGKTVDELDLDTVINQNFFPIFGRGWSRLIGKEPGNIALSRLSIPDTWSEPSVTLEVIDNENYVVIADDKEIIKGKVGALASGDGVSLLVSEIKAEPGTTFTVQKLNVLKVISKLSELLTVEDKGKDTGVLTLSLTGDDPARIAKILNNITQNYLLQNVERKSEEAEKSLNFLNNQLPSVRASLDDAENKLNKFRQANDSVDLTLEAKSTLDTMVAIETQLNESTFKEAEISKLYTKEHPAYRALLEKRNTLLEEKNKINKRIVAMPRTQQDILRLTRDVDAGKAIYMQLLNKQQELSITKASTVGNVRIIDPAETEIEPVAPKKAVIIIVLTLFGCAVSVGIVLLKAMLHRGIESPEVLEERGINVYASIPLSDWQKKNDRESLLALGKKTSARAHVLLAEGNPADLAIEAIRSLRTSLHFAMMESKNNVLMISGASPNIGKTFVSMNLSAIIVQAGQRVLVIDADMRKGYSHVLLNSDWKDGLSDILSGRIDARNAIKKTTIEGLDFIPRGQIPPNPSELLMHKRFESLLDWASENYDLVLVDTPPILAVTDAAIIGRHAGTTLMIARFAANTVKEIDISIKRFAQNGIDVKGIILNAVERKASNYYGNYGYYQYEYKADTKE